MPDLETQIIDLAKREPDLTIRELAERTGTQRDTVKSVLAHHLAESGGSRLPQARRAINRLAARAF